MENKHTKGFRNAKKNQQAASSTNENWYVTNSMKTITFKSRKINVHVHEEKNQHAKSFTNKN